MGSRPPRQHALPKSKPRRQPPIPPHDDQTGLRMESISVFIGLATFPVALGAAGVAYTARQDASAIATAMVITAVAAVLTILFVRSQRQWRRDARMSNELLLAMLVATIGIAFLIGGLASLSVVWITAGAITMLVAWFIGRMAKPTTQ